MVVAEALQRLLEAALRADPDLTLLLATAEADSTTDAALARLAPTYSSSAMP